LRDLCDRVACFSDGKIDCISEDADIAIQRYHELSELKRGS